MENIPSWFYFTREVDPVDPPKSACSAVLLSPYGDGSKTITPLLQHIRGRYSYQIPAIFCVYQDILVFTRIPNLVLTQFAISKTTSQMYVWMVFPLKPPFWGDVQLLCLMTPEGKRNAYLIHRPSPPSPRHQGTFDPGCWHGLLMQFGNSPPPRLPSWATSLNHKPGFFRPPKRDRIHVQFTIILVYSRWTWLLVYLSWGCYKLMIIYSIQAENHPFRVALSEFRNFSGSHVSSSPSLKDCKHQLRLCGSTYADLRSV